MKLIAQLPGKLRRPLGTAVAIIIYLGAAYIVVGRGLLGDFTGRLVSNGAGHDPSVLAWCLAWFPHALDNYLDPFFSRAVWWPVGINLAWVTSIPGAALLAWPITQTLGPVASFNALSFLALPASAFGAFLLCRSVTGRIRASIIGGYVFGFSPYFLGHLQNHLNLILAFPIPLAALLAVRLLKDELRSQLFAPMMALLLVIQVSFSLELFATMTAVGIGALLLSFAIGPEHWRVSVVNIVAPIAASYAIAAVLLAPYAYYLFASGIPRSAVVSPGGVSIDLLNFLIPTDANQLGAHAMFRRIAERFTFRPESGGWIAWPLLAIVAMYLAMRWRKPLGKVLIVLLALLAIAALGPRLRVGGHELIGMPWKIVEHIPLVRSALPARLTMYSFMILGVMTATILSAPEVPKLAKYALAIAIPLFMTANLDYRYWTTPLDVPPFFTSDAMRTFLTRDETVVILPYGNRGNTMLWQAVADFYFRMAGGYTGSVMLDEFQQWPAVNALYWDTEIADADTQVGAFLAAHDVGAIIMPDWRLSEYRPVLLMLNDLCRSPTSVGGVIIYPIATDKIAKYRGMSATELERSYDRDRFDRLVVAADKYLAMGAPAEALTPSRAAMMALIPRSWGIDNDIYTKDGLILGPWKNDQIQVGVVGSYEALQSLIADYRADAAEVYFPFPHPLAGPPSGNTFMRKLVLMFDRAGLQRAAAKAAFELSAQ